MKFLEGLGIFQTQDVPEARRDEHIAATVAVAQQRRRMVITPDADLDNRERPYARLRLRFDALLEANEWQMYVDKDKWLNRHVWWKRHVDAMSQASADERRSIIQSAIVHAFDDLDNGMARAQALYRLQRLGERLTESEASLLAEQLATGPAFGAMETDGIHWLLDQSWHAQVRGDLLNLLSERREERARVVLARILAEGGIAALREACADPRPGMRAAGARGTRLLMAGDIKDASPEILERARIRLRPGLEVLALDKEAYVSVEALLAMAYFGDDSQDVRERLEVLWRDGSLNTRLEVVRAMGYMPGKSAHPFLTRVLATEREEGSGALRAAALRAMGRSGHKDAVRNLAYYLTNDRDPSVQDAAAEALADSGSDEARFMLVDALMNPPSRAGRRARLVDCLGRFRGDVVEEQLRRFLGDKSPEVVAAAAVRSAEHGMGESVPYLIELLRTGRGGARDRARTALEVVTSYRVADAGYSAVATRYGAWWARERGGNARMWFRTALKRKGYEVDTLGAYMRGEKDLRAVPVFVRALRDGDGVIRRNAAQALRFLAGDEVADKMGEVGVETTPRRAEEIATHWSDWYQDLPVDQRLPK